MNEEPIFDHEKLDVYQIELLFVAWVAALLSTSTITREPPSASSLVLVVVHVFRVNQIEDEHENDNEEE